MGRRAEGFGWYWYTIVCDDPYHRMCRARFGPYFGKYRVMQFAQENGWYVSEETDRYACPNCIDLHRITVDRKIENGSMTREEADESGDPFTAAFIAMMFGGDPLAAGLTTMFTGSTPLGVIIGIMAGDHRNTYAAEEPLTSGGGETGGGGAGGAFDAVEPSCVAENAAENTTEPVEEADVADATAPLVCESPRSEEAVEVPAMGEREDTEERLPVIVDPFESAKEERAEVGGEAERFTPAEASGGDTVEVREESVAADAPTSENSFGGSEDTSPDTGSDTSY